MFKPGDVVVYIRDHDYIHAEIGVVKSVGENVCFVAYHCGDTCAGTKFENLRIVENAYATKALCERAEQLGTRFDPLCERAEDWSKKNDEF